MFIGEYRHTADAKGRISIPAKFREHLGECFFITEGLDNSLFLFSPEEWEAFEGKLSLIPLSNRPGTLFARKFLSGATEVSLDRQGRIVIPMKLRKHAGLEKDAYIIGVGNRVEIWSEENWEKYNSPDSLSYEELVEHLEDLGI